MALDIPALPSANQVLRYAKASYDFARDGGDLGLHSIPGQQVPPGALLFGPSWVVTTPFTGGDSLNLQIKVGAVDVAGGIEPVGNLTGSRLDGPVGPSPADGSYPISLEIRDTAVLSGALTIYVWYVL